MRCHRFLPQNGLLRANGKIKRKPNRQGVMRTGLRGASLSKGKQHRSCGMPQGRPRGRAAILFKQKGQSVYHAVRPLHRAEDIR